MELSFSKSKGIVFDLEVVPSNDEQPPRIIMLGALCPDSESELELKITGDPSPALQKLDSLSEGKRFILGHNIIEHDLPILRKYSPYLSLHSLPVIDTLRLSPLAFPQNPYHRLVKDYKLIRDSLNSPLSDCRSAWTLFKDQFQAFTHLNAVSHKELLCYQTLLAPTIETDLGAFFASLTGRDPLPLLELKALLPQILQETDPTLSRDLKVCRTRLEQLLEWDLQNDALHLPLAYALAWFRVSGGNSVLAPWVRHQFPEVQWLISELRDLPCERPDCQYCQTTHNPRHELKRYFGFPDFRYEQAGKSLQYDIVLAGMRGRHVLAVLATGGGKSLCYQLPALNRFHRNGSLTVIISPLQSLMKDQVDGLLERNIQCAAALNGLLTMPERADVLEKIQMGDIGILLVSPEQFRNKAFRRVLSQRQVGAWIFDEAHCLSKWGSDFRPDYLYVSRFISEYTGEKTLAQIGCFTATAKPDVLADIKSHFRDTLNIDFFVFHGGHERTNLCFDVLSCIRGEKWIYTDRLLHEYLDNQDGGAVVFVSSRKNAEELSDFLIGQGWPCRHFHAGLEPNTKTDIQDSFKAGQLRIIVATNAFGMGVDKADIRLVIHADIPGSLENYLQEAGRAGRDQQDSRCILLYDPQDIETQFGMSERSKLSIRDIQQILRKLRNESNRRKGNKLVITAGEILQDDSVDTTFSVDERDAETKVVTAVAWLERGEYLKREENHTQIFPGKLNVAEEEAEKRLTKAQITQRRREEYRAILRFLYNADVAERINTDQLMQLTSLESEEIASALKQLEELGILINDSQITLYVRYGVAGTSLQRLQNSLKLEAALLKRLPELMPDADQGEWQDLHLPVLTMELKALTEIEGLLPIHILRLLRSLAQDHDTDGHQRSTFELRQLNRDYLKLRIKGGHPWARIVSFGDVRRKMAGKFLEQMIAKLPAGMRGADLLIETSFGELLHIIENDLELPHLVAINNRRKVIEHVLLYLHRQEILTLNHGMTVMRRAMTIEVNKDDKRKTFLKEDFLRLDEHYREKRIQVHVMREYAEQALDNMAKALRLVLDYFTASKQEFIKGYFTDREDVLKLATSEESWNSIIGALNPTQKDIVADDEDLNRLILAGPGSGKTRVIVHRIAYLLRVRRIAASSIVALTFNRHAANEIRKRLIALVGADAYGVSVMTYHSMAMRLTGTRFERDAKIKEDSLDHVLKDAVELLEGKRNIEGEDDLREQLLRGYRYILVDEYQDINEMQYRLVSALAGRHVEEDGRLCILAVGDDDQNIYAWRDTNNIYIERFREDYSALTSYLIENYRSSRNIINVSNQMISLNSGRMKKDNPVQIDHARVSMLYGGEWETRDARRQGRVLRMQIKSDDVHQGNVQAQAAVSELRRLIVLENGDWNGCAIMSRTHRYLVPIQALCEKLHIPYFMAADKDALPPITRQRSFVAIIDFLRKIDSASPIEVWERIVGSHLLKDTEWERFFREAFEQLRGEFGDSQLWGAAYIDWMYDYVHEIRQQPKNGLYLGTVHSAKGLEFRHVVLLDGGWNTDEEELEAERRLYYVGMTRAEQTLTLCEFTGGHSLSRCLTVNITHDLFQEEPLPELDVSFQFLTLKDIDIGFVGRHSPDAPIHRHISKLQEGDVLTLKQNGSVYQILNSQGCVVGKTATKFNPKIDFTHCEVATILVRFAEDESEEHKKRNKSGRWEVVVPRGRGRKL
ncbi:RecQ family ATP-dependent DNA helicase [Pseudocitrobacter faecalis]|uniref:RecQ family ATP-dependent DNA helicase n=1 Tax=Pseudocitrobacter faecalis TaxID=1398493 RepID=UPI0033148379